MSKTPEVLRDMALECRMLAYVAKSDAVRVKLLDMADKLERLAVEGESKRSENGEKVPC